MIPSSIMVEIQNKESVTLASLRGTNLYKRLHFVFYTMHFFDPKVWKIVLRQNNRKGSLWIVHRNCA